MTTPWDQAVRTLYPVLGDAKDDGPPLASTIAEHGGGVHYYCGGPDRRCDHATCRAVSALAEADHLTWDTTAQRERERKSTAARALVGRAARVEAFRWGDPTSVVFTGEVVGYHDAPTFAIAVVGEPRPLFWRTDLVRELPGLSPAAAGASPHMTTWDRRPDPADFGPRPRLSTSEGELPG